MASAVVDEPRLSSWGAEFARTLRPPVVVGVSGELGAGKTTLVRAIASALGVTEPVTSPTFALVHRYPGRGVTVHHVDAYRLKRPADAADLGLDDIASETDAVVLIEWPERLGTASPPLDRRVALQHTGDSRNRRLESS